MLVLCATKGDRKPHGLENIPVNYTYKYCTEKPWAKAANKLLDGCKSDALFLDDDIELTPDTFRMFEQVKDKADVIGFTLLNPAPEGFTLQTCGYTFQPQGGRFRITPNQFHDVPAYVAHVTASCIWLSKRIIQGGIRFPVWPGQHHEDVAFTHSAWLQGFKVAYCPGVVIHHMAEAGNIGATKAVEPNIHSDRVLNWALLQKFESDNNIQQAVKTGVIPIGAVKI